MYFMANITVEGKNFEGADGGPIQKACESVGIPFSCKEGVCGSCLVDVTKGAENLGELNDAEVSYGLTDKNKRLACQCKISSGDVELEYAY